MSDAEDKETLESWDEYVFSTGKPIGIEDVLKEFVEFYEGVRKYAAGGAGLEYTKNEAFRFLGSLNAFEKYGS